MPHQVLSAKWLITCEEKNRVLENHALVIEKGSIKALLPIEEAKKAYPDASFSHYGEHALCPGFINGHTHVPMNYFRGLADDLPLLKWLNDHIWPAEKKWLSPEFVYDASVFAIAEMLRSGTTCFNDMFFFMPSIAKAIEDTGIRGHVGITIISFPNNWASNTDEEFSKGMAFYEEFKGHERVVPTLAPHALYTVTEDDYLIKIRDLAEKHDLKINMHVQEPANEIDLLVEKHQARPLQRLKKLGLLTEKLIAVHMLHLSDEDIALVKNSGASVVHCPQSNMKLGSGFCPAARLLEEGINVGLGTDGAASNNDLNMLGEMQTAAFLAKYESRKPEQLSAETVLQMATLRNAKALGMGDRIGSLAIGKSADCIAIHLENIESLPLYHPISQIVYAASRHQVTDVWVQGKQLLKNRKLTGLDEKELIEKAQYWGKRIQK